MTRLIAGSVAAVLLTSGAVLFFTGKAAGPSLPSAPPAGVAAPLVAAATPSFGTRSPLLASPKSREEKRFSRADKDEDGRVTATEMLEPRRKAFARLDTDGNGSLSFDEWAVKTEGKFASADADHNGWLNPAEYAATAPKAPKHKAVCSC